jgi:hypothetical protein
MLIGVFENPLRFRLDLVGADLSGWYGGTTGNGFVDEIDLHAPNRPHQDSWRRVQIAMEFSWRPIASWGLVYENRNSTNPTPNN